MEVLMPQQIPGKWRHWLNVPSSDFIQIFKFLWRSQEALWDQAAAATGLMHHYEGFCSRKTGMKRVENCLLQWGSRACVPSWMHSLCLLLSRPRAGRSRQRPTNHQSQTLCPTNPNIQTTVFDLLSFGSTSTTLWSNLLNLRPCIFPSILLDRDTPSVSYFPGDGEVVLSLAARSDDQVSLVQGLHHLLRLVETNIVEVGVGYHTLYIGWRDKECKQIAIKGNDVDVSIMG